MDPEALVQCPYDKSHQVRVARLPYHLVKCQRNNPQIARLLATCPFNARHRVPRAELQSHVAFCPNRRQPDVCHEPAVAPSDKIKGPEVPAAWQSPPCQEDWEAELDELEDGPPFILTVRTGDLLLPGDSSAPAAPPSQNRASGTAAVAPGGRPGTELGRRAHKGPRTAAAAPGQCSSAPQDRGHRSAGGGSAHSGKKL